MREAGDASILVITCEYGAAAERSRPRLPCVVMAPPSWSISF
jgi:hypothetical protein